MMEKKNTINIAIDGPAGAGKSTIAKKAAAQLGYVYVDTGAMYRAMALFCIRQKISENDEPSVVSVCSKAVISIEYVQGEQQVLLNGENVNPFIRTEEVSRVTSVISVYPKVREKLLSLQQTIAATHDVIMDGRDIGTNVLPQAQYKIYLTASVETRAKRRYLEQKQKGLEVDLKEIEKDIEERDYRDTHRECAPLKVAEGAMVIDSSNLSIEEVVKVITDMVQ